MIRKLLKRKNSALIILCAAALALSVVGCEKQAAKPSTTPPPKKPAKAATAPVAPTTLVQQPVSSVKLPPAQTNQFDFSAKKDPFKPYIVVDKAAAGKKMANKDALPIHSFDVSQFRLIGVVADPKGNKAMVVDPQGKAYVLRLGMTIGKNEGKITQITTSGVDVVEQFRDDNNKMRKETIRIPLLRKP
jgi:type IV pilus assembly protein PilP